MQNSLKKSLRLERAKEVFLEWSTRIDLNCYTKLFVYGHRPFIVFIWMFILFASSATTFWLISKSIIDYYNYDVVSQIGIAYEIKPPLFPTVTICDNNPYSTLKSQEIFERVAQNFSLNLNDSKLLKYIKLYVNTDDFDDEKRKEFGLLLSQFTACSFKDQPCNTEKELKRLWMYENGNCWQFNSPAVNSKLKETYNGVEFGLDLTIKLENQNKYISKETYSQGLIVYIHNHSFSPLRTEKAQTFVETGKKTFIGIKRIFNYKMPSPYSECIDLTDYKSDLYDYIKLNRTYRQADCLRMCRQKIYQSKCKCNLLNGDFNYLNSSLMSCNVLDSSCIENLYYNHSREECEKKSCPLECDSIEYDLKISSLVLTNKESIVRLAVYYHSLEYTFIKESPKTTQIDLFANIGGTLGLFISASIFTLFEIIEVLILVIHALFGPMYIRN